MSELDAPARFSAWAKRTQSEDPPPPPTRRSLGELVEAAIAFAAERSARIVGDDAGLACGRGCAWCCHLPVLASVAEVIHALDYARSHLPAEALRALEERARLAARRYPAYASEDASGAKALACPFLIDAQCIVYAARPLACRGWNSYDAERCRAAYERGSGGVKVPINRRQQAIYANAGGALCRGLAAFGLQPAGHLAPLLDALLAGESAEESAGRWLSGAWLGPRRGH